MGPTHTPSGQPSAKRQRTGISLSYPILDISAVGKESTLKYVPEVAQYLARSPADRIAEQADLNFPSPAELIGSCICAVLGYVPASIFDGCHSNLHTSNTPGPEHNVLAQFYGMSGMMIFAKGLLPGRNEAYLRKRWEAYAAGSKIKQAVDFSRATQAIMTFQNDIETDHFDLEDFFIKEVVHHIVEKKTSPIPKLMRQVDLIYRQAGLKSLILMEQFARLKESKAFALHYPVVAQAVEFLQKWKDYKKAHAKNWEFGRLLTLAGLPTYSEYPDLYYSAMAWAKRSGALGTSKIYVYSNLASAVPRGELEKDAVQSLRPSDNIVTTDHREKLDKLGITVQFTVYDKKTAQPGEIYQEAP
uniref:Uncharacterized protein n=1 Tax=Daphnia magna TaxID=35525 RepID=A0A0N7ZWY7_9CRUS